MFRQEYINRLVTELPGIPESAYYYASTEELQRLNVNLLANDWGEKQVKKRLSQIMLSDKKKQETDSRCGCLTCGRNDRTFVKAGDQKPAR